MTRSRVSASAFMILSLILDSFLGFGFTLGQVIFIGSKVGNQLVVSNLASSEEIKSLFSKSLQGSLRKFSLD